MDKHITEYRVIYADTDQMGVVYYANYLKWFEIGRTEALRSIGLTYKSVEEMGYLLPVSEVVCKYLSAARYDDLLSIETTIDTAIKGYMKFNYLIFRKEDPMILAQGYTKHPYLDTKGKVIRPPRSLMEQIKKGFS